MENVAGKWYQEGVEDLQGSLWHISQVGDRESKTPRYRLLSHWNRLPVVVSLREFCFSLPDGFC